MTDLRLTTGELGGPKQRDQAMATTRKIEINCYLHRGEWCYACWIDGEHDHNDVLADAKTREEAIEALERMFPGSYIRFIATAEEV